MHCAKDGRGWIAALLCLASFGCRTAPQIPYPSYLKPTVHSSISGSNGFEAYVQAATSAEATAAKYLKRTHFTPGQRDRVVELLANPISRIAQAGEKPFEFRFEAAEPFAPRPHRSGWRLIGLAFQWRIESAVRDERTDDAIRDCVLATRFGFDLSGGDCSDASLGYMIVDDARRAILKAVPEMTSAQFSELAEGLASALKRQPTLESTLTNERANMLEAVDAIQSAYRSKDFQEYRIELRQEIQPAIKYLQGIDSNDPKRADFFDSLAEEAKTVSEDFIALSKLNARQRGDFESTQFNAGRPWRRWSKYFFQGPAPLFSLRDRTIALTRMFAIHASIRSRQKAGKPLPGSLASFQTELRTDPFSGKDFSYSPTTTSFELYSVGADFRDDGGETDEAFRFPDLTLESRSL